jgi:murein DD-endopeptidase MepM/ murein hydrolase activator NlpD
MLGHSVLYRIIKNCGLLVTAVYLLSGCGKMEGGATVGLPTLVAAAVAPGSGGENLLTDVPVKSVNAPPMLATYTAVPTEIPTPAGVGVSPRDVEQKFVPDAGPEQSVAWRPPPYEAPLSLHPDDHYWLIRPIPINARNYELEWYPFGNDVQSPNLSPYRVHHGIDLPNETGTPILAAGSGTVIHAGALPSPRNGVNYYGNTVVIQHDWQWQGQDVYTLYAHTLELFVVEGEYVEQGQVIAGVGSSGEVTGPHLHFEVRVGENLYGTAQNPALWMAPYEGYGTIAGRFVDRRGRMISSARLSLRPLDGPEDAPIRYQMTYYPTIASDPVWRENFVFADVPAGNYELILDANDGVHRYRREVQVFPGQTSFVITSTEFEFFPTPTPIPTPEPTFTPLVPLLNVTPEG